jgi:hypothetical protein
MRIASQRADKTKAEASYEEKNILKLAFSYENDKQVLV